MTENYNPPYPPMNPKRHVITMGMNGVEIWPADDDELPTKEENSELMNFFNETPKEDCSLEGMINQHK